MILTIQNYDLYTAGQQAVWWLLSARQQTRPAGRDFFSLLDQRLFPSATTMRCLDEMAHGKLPGMFHDLFGHVPPLAVPICSDYLLRMSRLAMQHIEDEDAILLLARPIS